MAKPISVVATSDGATSSSSRHHPSSSPRPRRRPPRRRSSSPSTPAPSSTLLSVLASIVASSPVVASNPAPLPFLCPSLTQPSSPSKTIHQRSIIPSTPRFPPRKSRHLPSKFERGNDGVWRKAEGYTLYGSTVCSSSCRPPTNTPSADQVDTDASPDTNNVNVFDDLPVGWSSTGLHNENRTTLILALSLVLASFICFFIVGCLFWRRNVRRKHKDGDIELKARRKSRSDSIIFSPAPLPIDVDKGIKKKIWARATARWKANARYTARQRKGKRSASIRSQPLDSTTTLHPSTSADPPNDSASIAQSATYSVSRRPSSISLHDSSHSIPQHPLENSEGSQILPATTNDLFNDTPSLPPAYRQGTLTTPNIMTSSSGLSIPNERATSTLQVPGQHLSRLHISTPSFGSKSSIQLQEADSSSIPVHAAHVATDDKALLARLADFAERPPDVPEAECSHQVSVPVWEDEQLEDFAHSPSQDTSGPALPHSRFPPPPTKGKMAEPSFYAYRYSFEEFSESIEPSLEPSAPPFEAPGAPITNDMVMLPSAPPLAEDDLTLEHYPNVPQFQADVRDTEQSSDRADGDRSRDCSASRPLSNGNLPVYHP